MFFISCSFPFIIATFFTICQLAPVGPVRFRRWIVQKMCASLDENKSAGPDGITPLILRRCVG